MKIYQTTDMEAAIRRMAATNPRAVVFNFHWMLRHIRTRFDLFQDIPSTLLRAWDAMADQTAAKFQKEKGLLFYNHMRKMDKLPETDGLLFTEMPLALKDFEEFSGRAKKEIIVYRPPDWSMHQEAIEHYFPMSDNYIKFLAEIGEKFGKHDHLLFSQNLAMRFCGLPPQRVAVFNIHDIKSIDGSQMRRMLKFQLCMRGHYIRYDAYKPMVPPMGMDQLDVYKAIEAQPDAGSGVRLLRFGKAEGPKIPQFDKTLRLLVKEKCVMRYDDIHIILDGWQKLDYEAIDAVAEVRRKGCLKIRSMVEHAPVYPLGD